MPSKSSVFGIVSEPGHGISPLHVYHLVREDAQPHFHCTIELGFCAAGHGTAVTDGEVQPFAAGDFQIVFPFQTHRNRAETDDCVWRWIFLNPWHLSSRTGTNPLFFTELIEQIHLYGILHTADYPAICARLGELLHEAEGAAPYRNERICAQLTLLMLDMAALPPAQRQPVEIPTGIHAISAALLLLGDKLDAGELPTVGALAEACCMPISTFRRTFHAALGVSPKQHITICAIQKAAMLLTTTDRSITEIAGLCGYPEISTFNRAFRDVMDISPSAYRMNSGIFVL